MQMLSYVSESLIPAADRSAAIRQLMVVAQERNASLGVSGVLYLRGNVFFQTLEGPESAIQDVFGRIIEDSRHHSICLLINKPIEKPRFSGWSLECFHEPSSEYDYLSTLEDIDHYFRDEAQFSTENVYAFFEEMALALEPYRLQKAS